MHMDHHSDIKDLGELILCHISVIAIKTSVCTFDGRDCFQITELYSLEYEARYLTVDDCTCILNIVKVIGTLITVILDPERGLLISDPNKITSESRMYLEFTFSSKHLLLALKVYCNLQ